MWLEVLIIALPERIEYVEAKESASYSIDESDHSILGAVGKLNICHMSELFAVRCYDFAAK